MMRLLTVKHLICLMVTILVCCLIDSDSGTPSNRKIPKTSRRNSFIAAVYTKNNTRYNATANKRELCRWLRSFKHQKLLCLKRTGLPEIVRDYRKLTVLSCINHFKYEQWPCLRHRKYFRKIYRETSFMHSLSASAFMYLVAKACAAGKLENCKCASHGKSDNSSNWQWGGCGDNTKFAKNLTFRFFQLRRKGDVNQSLFRHNSEIGMRVVIRNEEKVCKCHGLSGSCTYKTCFKKIRPFDTIVKELKNHYHNAIKVESSNNYQLKKKGNRKNLLYLENSPNFCPSTVGRRCEDVVNCDTLCCGRGFSTKTTKVKETCKCRWRNESLYQVTCQQCERDEIIYICQ
ncbi:protein Wnt-4 isoform X1 [Diabrotica virgifera virgifera]|uniref:Protein Wnt n=1 Tax=Diabrotica virgifera virgifera TaxID=50390 RepID=A0A6P7GE72_DIAVI|nr:protein Wnt-4 isoform X1 [Diabrotica virgifera virgifera]